MIPGRRTADEGGSATVEALAAMAVLLLPVVVLALSFPAWVERQSMARVAAQQAARALAVADDTDAGVARASAVVDEIARNHGVDPTDVSVAMAGTTTRRGRVTATVTVRLPALTFPGLGTVGALDWRTHHTEVVDPYRGFDP